MVKRKNSVNKKNTIKMSDNYFKDKQSSSFLFIIGGALIIALLTKFNLLA